MRKTRLLLAGLTAVGLVLATPSLAIAGKGKDPSPPTPEVVSTAVVAPFNLAFRGSTLLVADGGANLVGSLARDGSITPVAADQPGAAGIAVSRDGRTIAFATTVTDEATFENTESGLNIWGPRGSKIYADTLAVERATNPDGAVTYGVTNPSACVSDALTAIGFPVSYTGGVDSHAYSVAATGNGWVVADAGANVLWSVDKRGRVRTLAVMPAQTATITAELAAEFGLPDCVVGVRYAFESVPTDVEVGRDGQLYVSLLPGGPESAALGARGSVYRVNPGNARMTKVAEGFLGATNIAIGDRGQLYVAELFGGEISVVTHGRTRSSLTLPGVVSIETDPRGGLWAGTMAGPDGPGTIVKVAR